MDAFPEVEFFEGGAEFVGSVFAEHDNAFEKAFSDWLGIVAPSLPACGGGLETEPVTGLARGVGDGDYLAYFAVLESEPDTVGDSDGNGRHGGV